MTRRHPALLLVLVCLAQFMVILDVSIVNVALPSIRRDLGFSTTGLQWVVNAYSLTFAGFLMLGGRASDLVGRRRVFLFGISLFTFSSLACALASSQGFLLGARALQGLGAAVISPASLAILSTSFTEGAERNRAFGVWGAMGGLGGAAGVLLGGALTEGLGWEAIFLINLPIGLAVLAVGRAVVPEGRREHAERYYDVAGAFLVTAGLVALVFGIVRTDALGWGALGVLAPIAGGVVLLAAFVVVETRVAAEPIMPLTILRLAQLRAANVVVLLLGSALFAMWFFLTLYMQQVLGASALRTGLQFLPMTLAIIIASTAAPRLIARAGIRPVLTFGLLLAAAGLALLTGVRADGTYAGQVLPGGLLAAAGLGMSLVPSTVAAVQGVPGPLAGLASGLINTSRLIGGALGLAALSTIAASHASGRIAAGTPAPEALASGYGLSFGIGAGLCFLGAVAAGVLLRSPALAQPEPEPT